MFKKRTGPRRIADRKNIFIISQRRKCTNVTCDGTLHTAAVNCYKKFVVGCFVSLTSTSRFVTSHIKVQKEILFDWSFFLACSSKSKSTECKYRPPKLLPHTQHLRWSSPGLLVLWWYTLQILTEVAINFLCDLLQYSQAIFRNTTSSSVLYKSPNIIIFSSQSTLLELWRWYGAVKTTYEYTLYVNIPVENFTSQ
jgi:hypothetical protein